MSSQPYADRAGRAVRPRTEPAVPLSRPTWFDFFFILFGVALSLILTDMSRFQANRTEVTPAPVADLLLKSLPYLLFLPLGVLLLWPLFYLTQRLAGRQQPLTAAEWLWGLGWLGAAVLVGWIVWQFWGVPPEVFHPNTFKAKIWVGYAVAVLALAALALLVGVIDLFGRGKLPWTHHLCIALLLWPAVPLLAMLLWGVKMA